MQLIKRYQIQPYMGIYIALPIPLWCPHLEYLSLSWPVVVPGYFATYCVCQVNVAVANGFREDELKELHETFNVFDVFGMQETLRRIQVVVLCWLLFMIVHHI